MYSLIQTELQPYPNLSDSYNLKDNSSVSNHSNLLKMLNSRINQDYNPDPRCGLIFILTWRKTSEAALTHFISLKAN